MARISVNNVAVRYSTANANLSLRRTLISVLKRNAANAGSVQAAQNKLAISGVNFELESGDRLVLVGGNGAGKTTLLKTLSGIYEPCAGSIYIDGTKSSFIEIGAGMDFSLSGKQNVEMHYLMRGHDRFGLDLERYVENVREFADLGESFYMPVNTYSSGMFVRLAFAMVTEVCPEILLLDEWLSAGDMFFMEKASSRMEELANTAKIMVLATHSHDLALKWCNKALVLGGETNRFFDSVPEALEFYQQSQ
ncbi:MAG: ATP-binding cassette domain-containing protein [Pseudomonadota bacterium]